MCEQIFKAETQIFIRWTVIKIAVTLWLTGGPAEALFREYLFALRDLEKHLTAALDFLKPHIELLENLSQAPIRQEAAGSEKTLNLKHTGSEGLTHAAPPSTAALLPSELWEG